ncbi:MAG: YkvA family protein [Maricaulaceae bacterium]|jgi:uncharacterized membrane protein YkvA (DUF1232 family)
MAKSKVETLSITIDLVESDIAYFRERLERARSKAAGADPSEVISGAETLMADALSKTQPPFVREKIEKLGPLISMLKDEDWRLEGEDRERVLDSLAYFVEPDDLIPDHIPGIGYFDDAIMIELVASELEPEIEAYEKFCEVRSRIAGQPVAPPPPTGGAAAAAPVALSGDAAAKLAKEREALQDRMRRRARRRGRGGGAPAGMHSPFSLF